MRRSISMRLMETSRSRSKILDLHQSKIDIPKPKNIMPSFDIVSEVDNQELDNALNQARKELAARFDFKGAMTEIIQEKDKIVLLGNDACNLKGCGEMGMGNLPRHVVDLANSE